jgi:hypothetical protein
MLKNATSFVLGSKQSSTYPRGYASGCFSPAAALDGLFEHPALFLILFQLAVRNTMAAQCTTRFEGLLCRFGLERRLVFQRL